MILLLQKYNYFCIFDFLFVYLHYINVMLIDSDKEYILCAAIKRKYPREVHPYYDGTNDICNIEIGYRHHDIYMRFNYKEADCPLGLTNADQGFYTSKGRFVNRYEAMEIAYYAGQVSERTALSKDWHKIQLNLGDKDYNSEEYWKEHDTHKFNMLFSEDLY